MKQIICIVCPLGCRLAVSLENDKIIVSGNQCNRGEKYAVTELTAPKRVLTSTVPVEDGTIPMVSVKTSAALPKELTFSALGVLKNLHLQAPIRMHQVIVNNVCNSGVDFIATKEIAKKEKN